MADAVISVAHVDVQSPRAVDYSSWAPRLPISGKHGVPAFVENIVPGLQKCVAQ